MKRAPLLALAVGFLVSFRAGAGEQDVSQLVICKYQKTVRSIRIAPEKGGRRDCQVTYVKAGVDEVVGQSRLMSSCQSILKNIQDNLEASNWSCKTAESASMTTSDEILVQ